MRNLSKREEEIMDRLFKLSTTLLKEGLTSNNPVIIDVANSIGIVAGAIPHEKKMEELNLLHAMYSAKIIMEESLNNDANFFDKFDNFKHDDEDDEDDDN